MTLEEKEVMDLLVEAHNKYVQMESTHPSDITDWVNSFHILQDILTRRILRRDYPDVFITIQKNSVPKIPGTRYKVGTKDEYTIYDGDEKKYYKN